MKTKLHHLLAAFAKPALVVTLTLQVSNVLAQNNNFVLAGTLTNYSAGPIIAADVNGDGKPDLVLGGTNLITIYTNNGAGGFVLSGTVPFPENGLVALAAANIRGNGQIDLIASGNFNPPGDVNTSTLVILTNNGSGVFSSNATYLFQGAAYGGITAVDVNGDGSLDLVVPTYNITEFSPNCVTVLTNNGSGVFNTSWTGSGFYYSHSAAVADFNGDGKPDIAICSYTFGEVAIFTNAGAGQFAESQVLSVGGSSESCAAANFSGVAGFAGVAVADLLGTQGITVCTNNGKGQLAVQTSYSSGESVANVVAADLTGTGPIDIIAASQSSNAVVLLYNNGGGVFTSQTPLSSGPTLAGQNGGAFAVADFNGDGVPDLAVAAANVVTIYFGLPALGVAQAPGNQVALFWRPWATNFVLQTTTNLSSTNWVNVSNGWPIIGITVPNASPGAFYRLHQE